MSFTRRMLLTCFGLGRLPMAPGTWASVPPAVVFGLMCYFELSAVLVTIVMAIFILAGCFACVRFSNEMVAELGKKDPGRIVADEVAGQAVTFLILPGISSDIMEVAAITITGFLLFRIFDIFKPWPIKKLENLPDGWGILCDDLLAGVYALVVLNIFLLLL